LPTKETIYRKFIFDILPCPAPRLSQSDKWKLDPNDPDPNKRQRKPVMKYFAYKNELLRQAAENGYKLTETLRMLVLVPMPKSWSNKKKEAMNNQPHKQRGDWDNYGKGFCDCLVGEDNFVWDARVVKLWAYKGQIIIF
jgi:Holliday junction resolvase RusA-like endonuclease